MGYEYKVSVFDYILQCLMSIAAGLHCAEKQVCNQAPVFAPRAPKMLLRVVSRIYAKSHIFPSLPFPSKNVYIVFAHYSKSLILK